MLKFQRTTPVFAHGSSRITYFADSEQAELLLNSKLAVVRTKKKKLVTELERAPLPVGTSKRAGSFGISRTRVGPAHYGGACGIVYSHKRYHGDLPRGHVVA